jgi:hypothetical protein
MSHLLQISFMDRPARQRPRTAARVHVDVTVNRIGVGVDTYGLDLYRIYGLDHIPVKLHTGSDVAGVTCCPPTRSVPWPVRTIVGRPALVTRVRLQQVRSPAPDRCAFAAS